MPTAFVGLMVYQNLRDRYGYNHHMVNHKCNFVNPEVLRNVPYKGHRGERRVARRVLIHTQNVERFNGLKSYTG